MDNAAAFTLEIESYLTVHPLPISNKSVQYQTDNVPYASVAAIHMQQGETIKKMLGTLNIRLEQLEKTVYKGNRHSQQNDAATNKPRGPVICLEVRKEGALRQGVCHHPSGKLTALDATDQAKEGYNIVTHENEPLCDFIDVPEHSVNESKLLAVNPAAAYHVVVSIKFNGVSIKFMPDKTHSLQLGTDI